MGNNRFNKPQGTVPDYSPREKKKEVEPTLDKVPCLVCKKMTHGYGSWNEGKTCSRKCEATYEATRVTEGERHAESVGSFSGLVYVPE